MVVPTQVKTKEIEFPSPEWDVISDEAKDLIKHKLLIRDPKLRLSARLLLLERLSNQALSVGAASSEECSPRGY